MPQNVFRGMDLAMLEKMIGIVYRSLADATLANRSKDLADLALQEIMVEMLQITSDAKRTDQSADNIPRILDQITADGASAKSRAEACQAHQSP